MLCQLLAALAADDDRCINIRQVWRTAQLAQTLGEVAQDGKEVWVLDVADTTLPAQRAGSQGGSTQ
jgi:hypothetical protein